MKNIKNIVKGFLVLAFIFSVAIATPVKADNDTNSRSFINAKASMKADTLMKLDSSTGVVMGKDDSVQVMGAKVISVAGGEINANILFGNSPLNFVIKTNTLSKLNGKLLTDISILNQLKVGNNISFTGIIASSTTSSIVVNGSHVVSQDLYNNPKIENTTSFQGDVSAINIADNSFTLKLNNGVTAKVVVSSNAIITVDNVVKTLASLQTGNKVKITGILNTDGSIITASKISVESENINDNNDNDKKDNQKENKSSWFGKIRNWFWK